MEEKERDKEIVTKLDLPRNKTMAWHMAQYILGHKSMESPKQFGSNCLLSSAN